MHQNNEQEPPADEHEQEPPADEHEQEPPADEHEQEPPADEPETFDRAYVEGLRRESATYRERARDAERALWRALVDATGRVVNPDEVPRPDGTPLDAQSALEAVEAALEARPYIAARRAVGNIGQHEGNGRTAPTVSLSALLRQGA